VEKRKERARLREKEKKRAPNDGGVNATRMPRVCLAYASRMPRVCLAIRVRAIRNGV